MCHKWVKSNLRSSEHGKWGFSKYPVWKHPISKRQLTLQLPLGYFHTILSKLVSEIPRCAWQEMNVIQTAVKTRCTVKKLGRTAITRRRQSNCWILEMINWKILLKSNYFCSVTSMQLAAAHYKISALLPKFFLLILIQP